MQWAAVRAVRAAEAPTANLPPLPRLPPRPFPKPMAAESKDEPAKPGDGAGRVRLIVSARNNRKLSARGKIGDAVE